MLGDALAAAHDINAAVATGGADLFERQALRWVAELIGFGQPFDGVFAAGGTISNLTALAAAREQALPQFRWNGGDGRTLALYCSADAHYSVRRAAELLAIGGRNVRALPLDARRRMDPAALRQALADDLRAGVVPVAVVATAGTTLTGAVDPLDELAEICAEHGVWLHVDGAYGLPAAATTAAGPLFAGLDRVDSATVDAHKWLAVPKACSVLLVRDGATLERTFGHHESYMPHDAELTHPVDRTLEYSRPLRALKLWLAFRVHGAAAFRSAIENNLAQAGCCGGGSPTTRGWSRCTSPSCRRSASVTSAARAAISTPTAPRPPRSCTRSRPTGGSYSPPRRSTACPACAPASSTTAPRTRTSRRSSRSSTSWPARSARRPREQPPPRAAPSRSTAIAIVAGDLQKAKRTSVGAACGSARNALVGIATTPARAGSSRHQAAASPTPSGSDVGVEEVGLALRRVTPKPGARQAVRQRVAVGGQPGDERPREALGVIEPARDGDLQRRAAGEGEELLRRARRRDQPRRPAAPADLPAGEREGLAGAGDRQRPLGHPRQRRERDVGRVVVDEVLVDLVGDRDQVVLAADPRDALQLRPREHAPGRVVWRVEQQDARRRAPPPPARRGRARSRARAASPAAASRRPSRRRRRRSRRSARARRPPRPAPAGRAAPRRSPRSRRRSPARRRRGRPRGRSAAADGRRPPAAAPARRPAARTGCAPRAAPPPPPRPAPPARRRPGSPGRG